MEKRTRVILDNIRSAHNVGSIFRTADGAGVEKIYSLGYTPTPVDRFGRKQPEIMKTSLGASETIPWQHLSDKEAQSLLSDLKAEGFQIVAVEQVADSIPISEFTPPGQACYVFGNEVGGVSKELLELADQIVEIPMQGTKESLNVSVTAGVILFKGG